MLIFDQEYLEGQDESLLMPHHSFFQLPSQGGTHLFQDDCTKSQVSGPLEQMVSVVVDQPTKIKT